MRLNKLSSYDQKKPTVFMDEKQHTMEDQEKEVMSIVHEIRNPLTAIKMTNQLMQEAFDRQERDRLLMQSYMLIIAQNVARIEDHLKEALTYKCRETVLEPVNISDCLDMAVGKSKDRIYLGGIALSKNYNGDHWILGNVEKLTTAFLNIIVNAIESIRSDKGKIWISVYEANGTTRITFKDNGSGMAPHIAEKMFDPHFSTKDGLGVGLTTVKETMNLHRANIVADSLPDVGTSISILFNSLSHDQLKIRSGNVNDSMSNGH